MFGYIGDMNVSRIYDNFIAEVYRKRVHFGYGKPDCFALISKFTLAYCCEKHWWKGEQKRNVEGTQKR